MNTASDQWQVALVHPDGEILTTALSTPDYTKAMEYATYLNNGKRPADPKWVPNRVDAMTYIDRTAGFTARAILQVFSDIADVIDDDPNDIIL